MRSAILLAGLLVSDALFDIARTELGAGVSAVFGVILGVFLTADLFDFIKNQRKRGFN